MTKPYTKMEIDAFCDEIAQRLRSGQILIGAFRKPDDNFDFVATCRLLAPIDAANAILAIVNGLEKNHKGGKCPSCDAVVSILTTLAKVAREHILAYGLHAVPTLHGSIEKDKLH